MSSGLPCELQARTNPGEKRLDKRGFEDMDMPL